MDCRAGKYLGLAGMKYIHDEWKEGNARENQALFDCQGKSIAVGKSF